MARRRKRDPFDHLRQVGIRAWVVLAAMAPVAFGGAACTQLPEGCTPGQTREQCLFNHDVVGPREDGDPSMPGGSAPETAEGAGSEWATVDQRLRAAAEIMASGLGPRALEDHVREWCEDEPRELALAHDSPPPPGSWVCTLPAHTSVGELPVFLEHAQGAITISVSSMSQQDSNEVLSGVLERWGRVCEGTMRPLERDERVEEFHTCEVEGGPQVVFGRFPRDLDADLWQVSLMLSP